MPYLFYFANAKYTDEGKSRKTEGASSTAAFNAGQIDLGKSRGRGRGRFHSSQDKRCFGCGQVGYLKPYVCKITRTIITTVVQVETREVIVDAEDIGSC